MNKKEEKVGWLLTTLTNIYDDKLHKIFRKRYKKYAVTRKTDKNKYREIHGK